MKIVNEYRLKQGITAEEIISELKKKHLPTGIYGTYIHPDAKFSTSKEIAEDISVNIAFPEDLSEWNSFDYILVMDENFGQPYDPFYKADEDEKRRFPFAMNVIGCYNKFMDQFEFLEKI